MHILIECINTQQKATQMLRKGHSTGPWGTLTKYDCLAPTQNRLPNALEEEIEGELNNLGLGKQIKHLILIFHNDISQHM